MQPFTNNPAMPQPHLVDTVRRVLTATVSQIVEQENANSREGEKCFPCPLFDQVWRDHRQSSERLSLAVNMNCSQRDQCFAGPTLRNDHAGPRSLPAFCDSHDRDGLCRKRLSK